MKMLRKGDRCPICGEPIKTDDPEVLELLSCFAREQELAKIIIPTCEGRFPQSAISD